MQYMYMHCQNYISVLTELVSYISRKTLKHNLYHRSSPVKFLLASLKSLMEIFFHIHLLYSYCLNLNHAFSIGRTLLPLNWTNLFVQRREIAHLVLIKTCLQPARAGCQLHSTPFLKPPPSPNPMHPSASAEPFSIVPSDVME